MKRGLRPHSPPSLHFLCKKKLKKPFPFSNKNGQPILGQDNTAKMSLKISTETILIIFV
jgi:hypothetical protein